MSKWHCKRCETFVDFSGGYGECLCTESPSPWELIEEDEDWKKALKKVLGNENIITPQLSTDVIKVLEHKLQQILPGVLVANIHTKDSFYFIDLIGEIGKI